MRKRRILAAAAALPLAIAGMGVAYADNIQDDIVDSGSVALVAGSSTTGTANIRVIGNSADGATTDGGCNWDAGESPLVLDVVTPEGVTANPDPVSISACGVDVPVTFTASASAKSGTATVTITSSPAGGGGYNNQVSIPITVTQSTPTDSANPTAGFVNIDDGAAWTTNTSGSVSVDVSANDNVGIVKYRVAESQAGLAGATDVPVTSAASFSANDVPFTLTGAEAASKEVWARFYDAAGNSVDASDSIGWDKTGPVVTDDSSANPIAGTPGSHGWYTSDVTVTFRASDNVSGFSSETNPHTFTRTTSGEGSAISVSSGTVYDVAGNASNSATSPAFKIDKTAPNAPVATLNPPPNTDGWNKATVVVSFASAGDGGTAGSGVESCTADVTVSSETVGESVSGTCVDMAGNESAVTSVTVKLDMTAPTNVAFVGGPTNNGRYFPNEVPTEPTCTATDALSDLKSCVVSGYSSALGTHIMTATATDNAGNVSTATRTYTVRKLTLSGFFAPVDMSGVVNTVKAGSTVPLKFRVFDGTAEQTATSIVQGITYKSVSCTAGAAEDAIEQLATSSGTSLRYDTTGGQFIQNWQTPKSAGACYSVTMKTVDDSSITALFKLK